MHNEPEQDLDFYRKDNANQVRNGKIVNREQRTLNEKVKKK